MGCVASMELGPSWRHTGSDFVILSYETMDFLGEAGAILRDAGDGLVCRQSLESRHLPDARSDDLAGALDENRRTRAHIVGKPRNRRTLRFSALATALDTGRHLLYCDV